LPTNDIGFLPPRKSLFHDLPETLLNACGRTGYSLR
jgi:hypothetical protein